MSNPEEDKVRPKPVEQDNPCTRDEASCDVVESAETPEAASGAKVPSKRTRRNRRIATAVAVVAVVAVAAIGILVWHEQPSFCSAICHTPMDPYLPTYEAELGDQGIDKWGNTVEDTTGMLATVHASAGKTCMDCHVPTLSEQLNEGAEWVSGSYEAPLGERTLDQLVAARGLEDSSEFCMNDTCHNFSLEDLEKKTEWMGEINPHTPQHGQQDCGLCHKAHRASVMYCSQCHTEAVVPDGWVSCQESLELQNSAETN